MWNLEGGVTRKYREYRVAWRRKGFRRTKYRTYKSEAAAKRFMLLFGAEPWLYNPKKGPEATWCCDGYECGCGGGTVREYHAKMREEVPALEFLRLESRPVGAWRAA